MEQYIEILYTQGGLIDCTIAPVVNSTRVADGLRDAGAKVVEVRDLCLVQQSPYSRERL